MLSSMNSLALIYFWCLIKHLSTFLYFIHVSFQSKHSLLQNCIFRTNLFFITDSFLGFLCSMYSLTGSEVMAVTKSFATFLTCLTFLCSMNSLMSRKTWTLGKGFAKVCTFIKSLPSMDSLMSSKMWTMDKGFATFFTFVWFFPSMSSLRYRKTQVPVKGFATFCTFIFWPSDAKSWLIRKDPDDGRDWRQEEKGTTEDEMVGWHDLLKGHVFG